MAAIWRNTGPSGEVRRQQSPSVRNARASASGRMASAAWRLSAGDRQARQQRDAGSGPDHLREGREAGGAEVELVRARLRADRQRLIAQAVPVVEQQHVRAAELADLGRARPAPERVRARRRQDEGLARRGPHRRRRPRRGGGARSGPAGRRLKMWLVILDRAA